MLTSGTFYHYVQISEAPLSGTSHVSSTPPTRESDRPAAAPPHIECPHSTTCLTLRCATAYSITAAVLMSVGEMMLAMLRCTNTSPGCRPRIVVSGHRESEQPSHTVVLQGLRP